MAELTPGMIMTRTYEGSKPYVYVDSEGFFTSGTGHLLSAEERAKYGLPEKGTPGEQLTKLVVDDADETYMKDYLEAEADAQRFFGDKWDSMPQKAKDIGTDLAFNLGATKLQKFPGFRDALASGDYELAANQLRYKNPLAMEDEENYGVESDWWTQTGGRGRYQGPENRAISTYNRLMNMYQDDIVTPEHQEAFTPREQVLKKYWGYHGGRMK